MAKRKLTDEMVLNAINAIVERGLEPSTTLIFEEVGEIGSYGTINKVFHPWRDTKEESVSDTPVEVIVPGELEEAFTQLAKKVWGQASLISINKLDKEREALDQKEQRYIKELAECKNIGAKTEKAREEMEEQLEEQNTLNSELSDKLVSLEKELEMLNVQVKEMDDIKSDNQSKDTEIAALKSTVFEQGKNNKELDKENKDLNKKLDKHINSITKLSNDSTTKDGEIQRLKDKISIVQEQDITKKAEIVDLKKELKEAGKDIKNALQEGGKKDKQIGNIEGQIDQLTKQHEEQKESYHSLLKKYEMLLTEKNKGRKE